MRDDHSVAASTTLTIDTTSPTSQPSDLLEIMMAAMATPMPTMPAVATSRMRKLSMRDRRRCRPGSMLAEGSSR